MLSTATRRHDYCQRLEPEIFTDVFAICFMKTITFSAEIVDKCGVRPITQALNKRCYYVTTSPRPRATLIRTDLCRYMYKCMHVTQILLHWPKNKVLLWNRSE